MSLVGFHRSPPNLFLCLTFRGAYLHIHAPTGVHNPRDVAIAVLLRLLCSASSMHGQLVLIHSHISIASVQTDNRQGWPKFGQRHLSMTECRPSFQGFIRVGETLQISTYRFGILGLMISYCTTLLLKLAVTFQYLFPFNSGPVSNPGFYGWLKQWAYSFSWHPTMATPIIQTHQACPSTFNVRVCFSLSTTSGYPVEPARWKCRNPQALEDKESTDPDLLRQVIEPVYANPSTDLKIRHTCPQT